MSILAGEPDINEDRIRVVLQFNNGSVMHRYFRPNECLEHVALFVMVYLPNYSNNIGKPIIQVANERSSTNAKTIQDYRVELKNLKDKEEIVLSIN